MKSQGRIVLLVVFFAGLAGLWWADQAKIPDRQKRLLMEPRVLPELVDTRPDELRRIEILGGEQPITIERRGPDRWRLISPIDAGADPSLVETLALNVKTLTKSKDAGAIPTTEAANYGLAPAHRTIKLWGTATDKPIATLEIGKVVHERRYVRNADGGAIEVVDSKGLSPVELSAKAWRDRALFHVPSFQVESIETQRAEGEMTLARLRNTWQVSKPWQAPADATAIEGALGGLTSLRVANGEAGFVANGVKDFAAYGLDRPLLSVTLIGGPKHERQQISIGKPAPRPADSTLDQKAEFYYARREDESDVLLVDARLFVGLGRSAVELRSKQVSAIELPRVDFLSMKIGAEDVALARSKRGWSRVLPVADEADNQAVYNLVKAITELQASEILNPSAVPDSGLNQPTATIKVWEESLDQRSAGAEPGLPPRLILKVGRHDRVKKTVYVQTGDEPNILAVPDAFLQSLPRGVLAFRTRQILALASNLVDRLTVEGGSRRYVVKAPLKPSAKGWRLALPVDAPVDAETLGQVLMMLGNFRVESFVTEKPEDAKRYGFDKPSTVVTWTLRSDPAAKQEKPTEGSLIIGKLTEGGKGSRYARLGSSETVFTLSSEQAAAFQAEWRDRRVLGIDADRARAVVLKWQGLHISLTPTDDLVRSQRTWKIDPQVPGLDFDPRRVPELLGVLSKFQAVKFAQLEGPIPASTGLIAPRFEVQVFGSDTERPRILRIGGLTPDGYLYATAAEGNSGAVFMVPIAGWEAYTKPPVGEINAPLELPAP